MRCTYCRKTMPRRGKKKYHADCSLADQVEKKLLSRDGGRLIAVVTSSFTQPAPMSDVMVCVDSTVQMHVAMTVHCLLGLYQIIRIESGVHVVLKNLDVHDAPLMGEMIPSGSPVVTYAAREEFEELKAKFKQLGTVTGRFSSSKPNLSSNPGRGSSPLGPMPTDLAARNAWKQVNFGFAYGATEEKLAAMMAVKGDK